MKIFFLRNKFYLEEPTLTLYFIKLIISNTTLMHNMSKRKEKKSKRKKVMYMCVCVRFSPNHILYFNHISHYFKMSQERIEPPPSQA